MPENAWENQFDKLQFIVNLLVKILWRSDKDKIAFNAIEQQRYGLWETVSKRLKAYQRLDYSFCLN